MRIFRDKAHVADNVRNTQKLRKISPVHEVFHPLKAIGNRDEPERFLSVVKIPHARPDPAAPEGADRNVVLLCSASDHLCVLLCPEGRIPGNELAGMDLFRSEPGKLLRHFFFFDMADTNSDLHDSLHSGASLTFLLKTFLVTLMIRERGEKDIMQICFKIA